MTYESVEEDEPMTIERALVVVIFVILIVFLILRLPLGG